MRTWLRDAVITISSTVAVAALAGCTTAGPADPPDASDRTISPTPTATPMSSAPGIRVEPSGPATTPPGIQVTGSGITGTTVVRTCPLERADPPCPTRPVQTRITVIESATGNPVTTVVSGTDGAFRIALAPGTYRVLVTNVAGKPLPRPASLTVTVLPGHYADVNPQLDSGLR